MFFSEDIDINTVCYKLLYSKSSSLAAEVLAGWSADDEYETGTLFLYVRDKYPSEWAEILPRLTRTKLTGEVK